MLQCQMCYKIYILESQHLKRVDCILYISLILVLNYNIFYEINSPTFCLQKLNLQASMNDRASLS